MLKILDLAEVDALLDSLSTRRDRAMIQAMLLGGLRRCEVLGLGLGDINAGERRVFIVVGKGGHQRITPNSNRIFETLAVYLNEERPETSTDCVFVVLKGPCRGDPLAASGLDQVMRGIRHRAAFAIDTGSDS